jgi:hypothetical protein
MFALSHVNGISVFSAALLFATAFATIACGERPGSADVTSGVGGNGSGAASSATGQSSGSQGAGAMGGGPDCGLGDACCDNGGCTRGICSHGRCVAFAGAYQDIAMCAGVCASQATLPFLDACECPAAATGDGPHPYLTDTCAGAELNTPAEMMLCSASNLGGDLAGSDWGGAYRRALDPNCFGSDTTDDCVFKNPHTQACTCPYGFTPVVTRAYAQCSAGSSGNTESVAEHVFCVPTTNPINTFGGVFQMRDNGGQQVCEVTNPRTGSCTCPDPTSLQGLRVTSAVDGFGGTLYFCMTQN